MYIPTPEENKREQISLMLKEVLDEGYIALALSNLSLKENIESKTTEVSYSYQERDRKKTVSKAHGAGTLDSVFSSLVKKYPDHPSLLTVRLVAFDVITDFKNISSKSTGAQITVSAKFKSNNQENFTEFRMSEDSIVTALAKCAFSVVEYYLNCDLAFKKLKFLIREAEDRNRGDIASVYISKISKIVNSNIIKFVED